MVSDCLFSPSHACSRSTQSDTIGAGPVPPGHHPLDDQLIADGIAAEAADHAMADLLLEDLPAALEAEGDKIAEEDAVDDAWRHQCFEGDDGLGLDMIQR